MANNRMYLVHKGTGDRVLIAKYYPSTGWYVYGDIETKLNEAFQKVDFPGVDKWAEGLKAIGGMWGDTAWAIEYETVALEQSL